MAYGTYLLSKALDCYNEYVANFEYKPYTSADGYKFARKNKKTDKKFGGFKKNA